MANVPGVEGGINDIMTPFGLKEPNKVITDVIGDIPNRGELRFNWKMALQGAAVGVAGGMATTVPIGLIVAALGADQDQANSILITIGSGLITYFGYFTSRKFGYYTPNDSDSHP